ncbi:MAG: hypothetical protein PWP54_1392 [Thermosipho sp. (in: thermotogales)]|nr:hypothetical protein [Thermosipho sp. (in: thermotogales)]
MELIFKGEKYIDSLEKVKELKRKNTNGLLVLKKLGKEVYLYFAKDKKSDTKEGGVLVQVISIKSPIEVIKHNFEMTDIVVGNVKNSYFKKEQTFGSYYGE